MRNKIVFCLVVIFVIICGVFVFFRIKEKKQEQAVLEKIKIITTLFPLYDIAKNIGGEKTDVFLLLPPGVEAHSFEPKPSDIVRINEGDIFIYTGKFMEPWAEDIIKGVTNKNLKIVNASEGIELIPGVFHDKKELIGSMDPHIWLDFDNAKTMADLIVKAIMEKDPLNKSYYEARVKDYKQKLTEIDNAYKFGLADCKLKEIIYGGHYAFGYLANRYGLKYLAAQGLSPDSEPTASDLAVLVNQIRKDNIKYIFYEELTSPKIAQTIADETNAKMLFLNAAHNLSREQFNQGLSFFEILAVNLENLKIGLECK